MPEFYGEDLAYIHATGFEGLAKAAARTLAREAKIKPSARVLDLGCGAGGFSNELVTLGATPWGLDYSSELVRLARQRVPGVEFEQGSIIDHPLPDASAAVAVGEVLNYATADSPAGLANIFSRVHAALETGGVFLFDAASSGRHAHPHAFSEGSDWSVGMSTDEKDGLLTRRITTFRLLEDNLWRRAFEEHRLRLWSPEQVLNALESAGFAPKALDGYDGMELPSALRVYIATKTG